MQCFFDEVYPFQIPKPSIKFCFHAYSGVLSVGKCIASLEKVHFLNSKSRFVEGLTAT